MKLFIIRNLLFIVPITFIYDVFVIRNFPTMLLPSSFTVLNLVSNTIETIEQATSYKKFTEFYDY